MIHQKRMKTKIFSKLLYILIAFTLFGHTVAVAQDTSFRQIQLSHGISLSIPSGWVVLEQKMRDTINKLGTQIAKNSDVELPEGEKETLLAVNAIPDPTGAMIRVSVRKSFQFAPLDISHATDEDLDEITAEMLNNFRKIEQSSPLFKLIEMHPIRIEKINNKSAIVISYIRAGVVGTSPWHVMQYKIPLRKFLFSTKTIEITLSYRESDAYLWKPILEQIKHSIKL
jgi:hypothetical protein